MLIQFIFLPTIVQAGNGKTLPAFTVYYNGTLKKITVNTMKTFTPFMIQNLNLSIKCLRQTIAVYVSPVLCCWVLLL